MSSAPLLNISLGLDCFDSCCSGIAVTCWWCSDIDSQAINTALRVTTSDPEAVVGVGLQVSHSQPAACCCTSIQHSISIYEGTQNGRERSSAKYRARESDSSSISTTNLFCSCDGSKIVPKRYMNQDRRRCEFEREEFWMRLTENDQKARISMLRLCKGRQRKGIKKLHYTAYPINSDRHTRPIFFSIKGWRHCVLKRQGVVGN